jgi:hypothetical protein
MRGKKGGGASGIVFTAGTVARAARIFKTTAALPLRARSEFLEETGVARKGNIQVS